MSSALETIGLPERIATRIQILLKSVPDPQTATRFLERLRSVSPAAFDRIISSPAALRCAIHVFAYSHFLSEAVLRRPERILEIANSGSFYRVLSAEEYRRLLNDPETTSSTDLARFRRRHLLRIV